MIRVAISALFLLGLLNVASADPFSDAFAKRDYAEAFRVMKPQAENGLADAQNKLGFLYLQGLGVSKDDVQAAFWFKKAADQGLADAQNNLAICYQLGVGMPRDYGKALDLFQEAAGQGNVLAQSGLGGLYYHGLGVKVDFQQAAFWFRKAADGGNGLAANNLGTIYFNGLGVPKDLPAAVVWYRKGAELGNSTAQNDLGIMYEKGLGVAQDLHLALTWFDKAAAQGDPGAIANANRLRATIAAQSPTAGKPSCPDRGVPLAKVMVGGAQVDANELKQPGSYRIVNFTPVFSTGSFPGFKLNCKYSDGNTIVIPLSNNSISCYVTNKSAACR
ncbi:tetratricopeptide repeat protein [Labrys neptuniae]